MMFPPFLKTGITYQIHIVDLTKFNSTLQENSAPGSLVPSTSGDITLNAGRKTKKLKVTSLCDRPIQVFKIKSA